MNSEQSEKIAQVVSLTSASAEKAQFHLEANEWNVELAISSVLDDDQNDARTTSSFVSSGPSSNSKPKSKFATLNDLQSKEDEDDEDSGNNYFAGGEKSGVMMKGRPDEKKANELVKDILQQASQNGSRPADEDSDFVKKEKKPKYFTGAGFSLAGSSSKSNEEGEEGEEDDNEVVERCLTFWKNGFSIDDGPLMEYDDPKNQEFLKAIKTGRAPTEYLNVKYGQPVEVKVAHRMEENYKPPPKKPMQAFTGSGYTLGGPSSSTQAGSSSSSLAKNTMPGAFPGGSTSGQTNVNKTAPVSAKEFKVDESLPITSIQIRLADGTRLVSKFNQSHLISDLRNFIGMSRPNESTRPFSLMTTFPNKVLENENLSLKDAGLLNAVIVQKYI